MLFCLWLQRSEAYICYLHGPRSCSCCHQCETSTRPRCSPRCTCKCRAGKSWHKQLPEQQRNITVICRTTKILRVGSGSCTKAHSPCLCVSVNEESVELLALNPVSLLGIYYRPMHPRISETSTSNPCESHELQMGHPAAFQSTPGS